MRLAGTTAAGKAEEYRDYVVRTGVADYQATAGNKGAFLLLTTQEEIADFLVISFWESYESIKTFAGEEIGKARYYPEDAKFLLTFERSVMHYECFSFGAVHDQSGKSEDVPTKSQARSQVKQAATISDPPK